MDNQVPTKFSKPNIPLHLFKYKKVEVGYLINLVQRLIKLY